MVFTSGCTGALRLVADIFPWSGKTRSSIEDNVVYLNKIEPNSLENLTESSENTTPDNRDCSCFCYLEDNHTSVLGMRRIACQFGAKVLCVTESAISQQLQPPPGPGDHSTQDMVASLNTVSRNLKSLDLRTSSDVVSPDSASISSDLVPLDSVSPDTVSHGRYHLFAYPGQSNFSGHKYPLSWTTDIPSGRTALSTIAGQWFVLVDIASLAATNPVDLTRYPAHFVTLSFYKMFGYPTGVGALLVRRDITELLQQTYFGGGTVTTSIARCGFYKPRPLLHER